LALTTALAAAVCVSPLAVAGQKSCSLATLKGAYGFQVQGSRPDGFGGSEPVVGVILRTYDGIGSFQQVDNVKGLISGTIPDQPGFGSYEVNPDCTGTTSFQPNADNPDFMIQEKFIIVKEGDEIRGMTAFPPPLMITSVAKRVQKH
jgi:hypothetical protein